MLSKQIARFASMINSWIVVQYGHNFDKFGPPWATLDHFGPHWTTLEHFNKSYLHSLTVQKKLNLTRERA